MKLKKPPTLFFILAAGTFMVLVAAGGSAQTKENKDAAAKEILKYQEAISADELKDADQRKQFNPYIEKKAVEAVDMKNEEYLKKSDGLRGAITLEEEEEIKFMQNVNRERNINDCMKQLEMIEGQMQEISTKLNGVENSQIASEVKKSKQTELQMKKEDLLKRKQMLNEKLELLEQIK